MSIIVLIAAVSVPAFKFITGSRSVDSGANVVNAMIGRARAAAIANNSNYGVFFYVDPRNDRSTLALVYQNTADAEYHGWSMTDTAGQQVDGNGATGTANLPVYYFDSSKTDIDPSSALQTVVTNETYPPNTASGFQRRSALSFQCILQHTASPQGKEMTSVVPNYFNTWWNANFSGVEIARDTELQLLPAGVGARVVVDPQTNAQFALSKGISIPGAQRLGFDRYLGTGCVMFDGQGRFTTVPFDVYNSSHLGQALMLDQVPNHVTTNPSLAVGQDPLNPLRLYSGFGVALYDRQAFLADAKINGYTEGDYLYGDQGSQTTLHLPPPPYGPEPCPEGNLTLGSFPNSKESLKQQWLDANASLLTATRYNGALTKSE